MADNQFPAFLETIDDNSKPLASEINDFLLAQGCKCEIKTAKAALLFPISCRRQRKLWLPSYAAKQA